MNMKLKNRLKKILTEALVACLLLAPAVLPPAGPGEVGMPGEVLTGSEQPGADDGERMESGPVWIGKMINRVSLINKLIL